ncbi:MAG TPA: 3-methyl-2-oxobutanoate hydroxymethyltransferase [Actinomycetota bacterium]|nr:3-methyl-2-oxobutanoate hydroxymethyltransferase [Actinomycetota bacterium]
MSVTTHDLAAFKARGEKFAMLTAYDYPTAQILDQAGVPVLLVGDSLANTILGYDTTLPVTMDEMIHHCKAVARGSRNALIVGDMPFMSYQASDEDGLRNAGRFLKEAGAHAVKIEGPRIELAAKLAERGIPVMGHLGLTPQSVHLFGGYKVQGRTEEQAASILRWAKELEDAGCFAIVLEVVPAALGASVTKALSIPTVGIGAGPDTDAQVLVINDLAGINDWAPKFVRKYADVRGVIGDAVTRWMSDVKDGRYPDDETSYT